MICFKDMTFCGATCANHSCDSKFTKNDEIEAIRWWGNDNAPVAYADMSEGCEDYKPEQTNTLHQDKEGE